MQYERPIYVYLSCIQDRIREDEVEFVDIYEDFEGRDILVFKCPKCGEDHTSLRFG